MVRQVRISGDDGIGNGVRVTDAETGTAVHGVRRVHIAPIEINQAVVAEVELVAPQIDLAAAGRFTMRHPLTGETVAVKAIMLEGGETIALDPAKAAAV